MLLCGIATHWTVEGTARDAVARGYRVFTLQDACASDAVPRHEAALDILSGLGQVVEVAGAVAALGTGSTREAAPTRGGAIGALRLQARAVISTDAPSSPPTMVADQDEIVRIFKTFDADGDNYISLGEFANLCEALGGDLDEGRLAKAFNDVDLDGNGMIDFNEFMRWWYAREE